MAKINDLTTGPIFPAVVKLSLPIIGTSFIHMAYSLTDVLWLGRTGSSTVTAVTTAGFFLWLLMALAYSTKAGTETLVAQCVGKKMPEKAKEIAENALTLTLIGSFIAFVCILIFAPQLLSFFELETEVRSQAIAYLRVVSFGMCFSAMNPVLGAIYLGHGDSRTPFLVNSCGLIVNIVLDPLLIFGVWIFPELGATGAAVATVFANILVFTIFLIKHKRITAYIPHLKFLILPQKDIAFAILKIGVPISVSHVAFCLFSMYIGRIVSAYGTIPLGVQNIGASIEALSWNTALGFATALSSFTGQNYGAGKYERIRRGYYIVLGLSVSLGLIATIAFAFYGYQIFSFFSTETEMILTGEMYLLILAVSQIFMCVEITSAGGFYGLGRSKAPAAISILFTGLRVPAALLVVTYTSYAYAGVWWCVSISSVFKGVIVMALYFFTLKRIAR